MDISTADTKHASVSTIPDEVANEILNLSEEETQEYFRDIRSQYEEFEEELKRRMKCWRTLRK